VALLTLFDTVNPYFMREYSAFHRSLAYNKAALKRMRWNEVLGWLAAKLADFVGKSASPKRAVTLGEALSTGIDEPGSSTQFGITSVRIAAARKYRPKAYAGKVILFKRNREFGGRYLDEWLGWGEAVSGKIEVCQLDANEHLEIFKSEFDRALVAQELRRAFEEVAAIASADDPTKSSGSNSESRVSLRELVSQLLVSDDATKSSSTVQLRNELFKRL
jgi:hypothetical protein